MSAQVELFEKLIHKYERYVAPFTFILGFVFDAIALKRIDLWIDHLVIVLYLALAGTAIAFFNLYEAGYLRFRILHSAVVFAPLLIQFGFGGLFSAFVIFYTKSAGLAKNWLFLFALIVLLVGNERFRRAYQRLIFQISIYFIAVFSYLIFLLPILLKKIGADVFILSGLASLFFIVLFIVLLSRFMPAQISKARDAFLLSFGGIYVFMNVLYFANIIPPAPLSLKESGIYHSVRRTEEGMYEVSYEKAPWYLPFKDASTTYHRRPGEPVYYFTAVFAPTKLNVSIFHQWLYYDRKEQQWVKKERIGFYIFGGRDGGYRGYSYKAAVWPGKWRVETVTEEGRIVGRETFTVIETNQEPALEHASR